MTTRKPDAAEKIMEKFHKMEDSGAHISANIYATKAIRRAIAAERRKERERCLKILRLAAADARELGDRSDHFGQAERAILGERQ